MEELDQKLALIHKTVAEYAKAALTGETSYVAQSADGQLLTVVDVMTSADNHHASIGTAVRLFADFVIIEHDMNNKPLVDALLQAGIPREQVILAYAGEPVPETAI
jgi:hypothetical protein